MVQVFRNGPEEKVLTYSSEIYQKNNLAKANSFKHLGMG